MPTLPTWLASSIVAGVTLIWAMNFLAQFVVDGWEPDVSINGVFMAVVGAALALGRGGGDQPRGGKHRDVGGKP